jgi:two-component system, response regulator PdtaR
MISDLETSTTQDEHLTETPTPLRILLADDNTAVLGVINRVVRFLGHIVVGTAVTGEECISRAAELQPDLILLDLVLPDRNGINTAAEISKNSDVPVVIVTGAGDPETLIHLNQANIAGHLSKPFRLEEVRSVIETVTQRCALAEV